MRRVLVTGGAGYVGSVLVTRLVDAGAHVTVLDCLMFGNHLPGIPEVEVVPGDIRDGALFESLIRGKDTVFHLAFVSSDPGYNVAHDVAWEINCMTFPRILETSHQAGVERFVFASSCSVYGSSYAESVDEETVPRPLSEYADQKWRCEDHMGRTPTPGMEKTVVRAATVCGRSPRQRLDLLVNRMTAEAVCEGRIAVSKPSSVRPHVHVEDLARAYVAVGRRPAGSLADMYAVAFFNQTQWELAELIQAEVGPTVRLVPDSSDDARSYNVSANRLREDLGFSPRCSVQHAVRSIATAIRSGALPDAMTSPGYYNKNGRFAHFPVRRAAR